MTEAEDFFDVAQSGVLSSLKPCPTDQNDDEQSFDIIGKDEILPDDGQNRQARRRNDSYTKSIVRDPQNTETTSTTTDCSSNLSTLEQSEEKKSVYSSVVRLLEPVCEGIQERVELLGELLQSKKLDPVPDVYDEMERIVAATERNERLQAGSDGQQLLQLTRAARSNLNADLHHLDLELLRQFGLHSVEVMGDGSCAFRAILISGMQKPDAHYSELREKTIEQVMNDIPYYSTVLRPGNKVNDTELNEWARTMEDSYTYGDELANIAVADRYHIQLAIFRAGELLNVVNPRDGHVEHTAFFVNVGTHYKALVAGHELKTARQNSERLQKQSLINN